MPPGILPQGDDNLPPIVETWRVASLAKLSHCVACQIDPLRKTSSPPPVCHRRGRCFFVLTREFIVPGSDRLFPLLFLCHIHKPWGYWPLYPSCALATEQAPLCPRYATSH